MDPVFTALKVGDNDAVDNDARADGTTGPVSLGAGETNLDVDAGI